MSKLVLCNRQRVRRINTPLLRRIVRALLAEFPHIQSYELGIYLVAESEIVRLNQKFVGHAGSTDVITFCHDGPALRGEIFVCLDEAVRQAPRFRTNWQSELVRYVVHGVLHLRGFDDQRPPARHKMKLEENRLLRSVTRRFPLSRLERKTKLRA